MNKVRFWRFVAGLMVAALGVALIGVWFYLKAETDFSPIVTGCGFAGMWLLVAAWLMKEEK